MKFRDAALVVASLPTSTVGDAHDDSTPNVMAAEQQIGWFKPGRYDC